MNGFLNGGDCAQSDSSAARANPCPESTENANHLHPSNDPERDGEIRYRRQPGEFRESGPEKTIVITFTISIHFIL